MLDTLDRPVGDDDHELRSGSRRFAEVFREPEVVTNKRRNHEALPGKDHHLFARLVMVGFASEGERLQLAVARDLPSFWAEDDRLVGPLAVGLGRHETAE